jgi:hypothetical protein
MAGKPIDPYAEEIASAKRLLEEKSYDDQSWSDWAGDVAGNAVRTARSILPTALGGEGEVGISDIVRGAYEAGKDAVTFPGDVITGKQALFDEAGRPLENAVARSFNTASTIGGASSAIPVPDNSLRVFGGVKSLTADKAAMLDAMKMESKGATPDEIWDSTGWFRGADGRWRYEIPDIGTTVNSAALQLDLSRPTIPSVKAAKLGDYLQHPEFFAAYPQFRGMDVSTSTANPNYYGMYYPRFVQNSAGAVTEPRIELNESLLSSGDLQKSTLLHEVQHAIQQKEGFAPGTNIQVQPFDRVNPKFERYNEAIRNDPDMQALIKIQNSDEYKNQVRKSNALFSQTVQPKLLELQNSLLSDVEKDALTDRLLNEYRAENDKIAPLIKELEDLSSVVSAKSIPLRQPKEFFTPTEAYLHYAGETEARNVQNRRNLRREDLRGTRPWDTQEYPYMDQLLPLYNDWRKGYAAGGEVDDDDDINDAIRIAKDVGGSASTPVLMEDAKGNKYDAQGNIIPPTSPGPNPARSDVTPQSVAAKAVNDPATYDALMERYAIPDRDIAEYETLKATVGQQPQDIQQMTHVGDRPRREMTVDMPLFGGEYSMGNAPYDVASGISGAAQTAYDLKTAPFYFNPFTAPIAAGMDVAEGIATNDPLTASLAIAFGPGGKYAKAAGVGATNYFMNPDEAEAGPERWFSKAMEVARALPMEKMTGQQALAMLRKGVSPEELKWTGADAFLPQQKQITKQDLVDYLAKNRVQTQDVVFGGTKPSRRDNVVPSETAIAPYRDRWDELVAQSRALNEVMLLPPSERDADIDDLLAQRNDIQYEMDQIHDKAVDATIEEMGGLGQPLRYGPGSSYGEQYVTPGGTDYRETLITLPQDLPFKERKLAELDAEAARLERAGDPRWRDVSRKRGELLRSQGRSIYSSGHWRGVPNVAGHIRTQVLDVTPPGANRPYKAFNVDEAQSDWAKSGREKGFVTPEDKASLPSLVKQYSELAKQHRDLERLIGNGDDTTPEIAAATKQAIELSRQMMDLSEEMTRIRTGGIPMAPYVTSTQGWTDLSIKKSIDQALDAGADYFTYTPGDVHVDRYSLSNHLGEIRYNPENRVLEGLDKQGTPVISEYDVPPEKLDAYVGKEMADKIRDQHAARKKDFYSSFSIEKTQDGNFALLKNGKPGWGVYVSKSDAEEELKNVFNDFVGFKPVTFSGLDLKVGGEGMIDYYNNIYKRRVEKVVKDATGKKVEWEVIPVNTADGPREQLGFRLTDDMKNARFSDFNKGGRVTNSAIYADSDAVNKALALTRD